MDHFLEAQNALKPNQDERDNPKSFITITEIIFLIKKFPPK